VITLWLTISYYKGYVLDGIFAIQHFQQTTQWRWPFIFYASEVVLKLLELDEIYNIKVLALSLNSKDCATKTKSNIRKCDLDCTNHNDERCSLKKSIKVWIHYNVESWRTCFM
jgi:hypothetical protein